jgi:hypothetical protein
LLWQSLDVASLGHAYTGMPEDVLDSEVIHAQVAQVSGQTAPESMPPRPFYLSRIEGRGNLAAEKVVKRSGLRFDAAKITPVSGLLCMK